MTDTELETTLPRDSLDHFNSSRHEDDVEKSSLRRHLTAASASATAPVAEVAAYKNDAVSSDPNAIGWEGSDDPACPMNWADGRKWTNIGALSIMTLLT